MHLKCLAVGDVGFAMRWMAALLVEVLVSVCWLGIKMCNQAVPITNRKVGVNSGIGIVEAIVGLAATYFDQAINYS